MSFLKNILAQLFNKGEKINPNGFLKQTGECMVIESEQFEIVSTIKYTDEIKNNASLEVQMLDGLIGKKTADTQSMNVCYLVYCYEVDGKRVKMASPPIYKDRITIHYLLEQKKNISIYVDRENKDNYYFDLEFLS
ncbi:hypothetical protein [Chitinophaga oryziterrae]|nr:hypothetical protein [Chitinophaga oryziterrae]